MTTDQRGPGFVRIYNGTVDVGAYEYLPAANNAVSVEWGSQIAELQTAADGLRLLPAGRNTDLPWLAIDQLQITLGQAQALTSADVFVSSANLGINYGPVTVSGSGTTYTIDLAQPINVADRVTITIVNPGISLFNQRIDVLPGDFNDDGAVNSQDLIGVRNEWLQVNGAGYTIFGDINGDGVVNVTDYNEVRALIGTTLPPSSAPGLVVTTQPPASVAAGSGFGLTVTAEDSSGNVDTSFNGTVTVALSNTPGGAALGGTLTVTAQDGVATFSGLTLDQPGNGYTLEVSSSGVTSATTSAIDVTVPQLVVTAQPPGSVTVGSDFGLTVTAEDGSGNVDTAFNGTVTVALSNNPGSATLGGTLTVTAQDGVATFSDLTLDQLGVGYTLQVSSSSLASVSLQERLST